MGHNGILCVELRNPINYFYWVCADSTFSANVQKFYIVFEILGKLILRGNIGPFLGRVCILCYLLTRELSADLIMAESAALEWPKLFNSFYVV